MSKTYRLNATQEEIPSWSRYAVYNFIVIYKKSLVWERGNPPRFSAPFLPFLADDLELLMLRASAEDVWDVFTLSLSLCGT